MGLWDSIQDASWNPFRRKSVILDDQNFLDSLQTQPFNNEFGDIGTFTDPISKGIKNAARLLDTNRLDPQPQEGRPWYDLWGKLKDAAPDINGAVQGTLTKIIILVIIVSIVALFGVSYVNAQANRLALAK